MARRFRGGSGRWDVWTGSFRQSGLPHFLLVISDLSRALREEERKAWQRLVRVMGHELNNSLTPIKSMASTLRTRLADGAAVDSLRDDLDKSLNIIASRAEALGRFMTGSTMLARLPAPRRKTVRLRALVERAAAIDPRLPVHIEGEDADIAVDPDQLEQLIINLVKNAVDAGGPDGAVHVRWSLDGGMLRLEVLDSGPGLSGTIICSCRFSRPSRVARASVWCCAGRSPKRTRARWRWKIAMTARAAWRGWKCRWREFPHWTGRR